MVIGGWEDGFPNMAVLDVLDLGVRRMFEYVELLTVDLDHSVSVQDLGIFLHPMNVFGYPLGNLT